MSDGKLEFDTDKSLQSSPHGQMSGDLDSEAGFNAVKKQILGTSVLQVVLVLLEIGVLIWYLFAPEDNVGQTILCLVVLFGGCLGIGVLQTKVSRVKKQKFKMYVVRDALARKCQLHSYRHKDKELEGLLPSLLLSSGMPSSGYTFALSDYLNGKYHGYKFRMMDYEAQYNGNRGTNVHLIEIELGRRLQEGTYIQLSELPRFFGQFVEDESYNQMPFFSNEKIEKKRVHVLKFKNENNRAPASGALTVTENWEVERGIILAGQEHNSSEKPVYDPSEILTESMADILGQEFVSRRWLHVHFEDDLLLIVYAERKDLFEPHFWYGFKSKESVEASVGKEVNQAFGMFDKILPELERVFPVNPVDEV